MRPVIIVAIVALTCVGCGGSDEQASKSAAGPGKNGGNAGNVGNGTPSNPVSVRDLIALLPAPAGWEREKPTGERLTTPVNFADAMVRLMKGNATVTAKITDSALNEVLMAPFADSLAGKYDRETRSGYEKAIKAGDAPAFEKWDNATKSGTLTVIVNRRFIIEIDGSTIDNPKVLHEILERMDLKKLADLK